MAIVLSPLRITGRILIGESRLRITGQILAAGSVTSNLRITGQVLGPPLDSHLRITGQLRPYRGRGMSPRRRARRVA